MLSVKQKEKIPQLILGGMTLKAIASMYHCTYQEAWNAFVEHLSFISLDQHLDLNQYDIDSYIKFLTQLN